MTNEANTKIDATSALPPMRMLSGLNPKTATHEECEKALNMITEELELGGYLVKKSGEPPDWKGCTITPDAETKTSRTILPHAPQILYGMLLMMAAKDDMIIASAGLMANSTADFAKTLNTFAATIDRQKGRNPASKGALFDRITTKLNPAGIQLFEHD